MSPPFRSLLNVYDRETSPVARVASALLAPAGLVWGAAMSFRRAAYKSGLLQRMSAPCRVVSVGGLSAGGSGKTQVVALLSRELASRGVPAAVIHGGYGGSVRGDGGVSRVSPKTDSAACGDEALELAATPGGLPVYVSRDRLAGCRAAWEEQRAMLCLLDDGAQHLGLRRDVDIVVMDGGYPFSNGRCLPAGPLRERPGALAEAHVAWLVSHDGGQTSPAVLDRIRGINPSLRFVESRVSVAALEYPDAGELPATTLEGARVLAFCGIARPHRFFDLVGAFRPARLVTREFPDHHRFSPGDAGSIASQAADAGAEVVVTTTKDHARSSGVLAGPLRYAVLRVALEVTSGRDLVDEIAAMGGG